LAGIDKSCLQAGLTALLLIVFARVCQAHKNGRHYVGMRPNSSTVLIEFFSTVIKLLVKHFIQWKVT